MQLWGSVAPCQIHRNRQNSSALRRQESRYNSFLCFLLGESVSRSPGRSSTHFTIEAGLEPLILWTPWPSDGIRHQISLFICCHCSPPLLLHLLLLHHLFPLFHFLLLLFLFYEPESHYVTVAGSVLIIQTRLTWSSQRATCLCLPSA